MNEKLIVKNFGPIREAELDLRKTTVFIGPQGSGKSTLAKLVAIFRDYTFIIIYIKDKKPFFVFEDYNIKNYFLKNTDIYYQANNYQIGYQNKKFDLTINEKFKGVTERGKPKELINGQISIFNELLRNFLLQERKPLSDELEKNLSEAELLRNFSKQPIYIPSERFLISSISNSLIGFINSNIALPKFLTEFGNQFEIARKSIKEFNFQSLNVTYKYEDSSNKIYLGKTKSIQLSESASGFQALIPLQVVVEHLYIESKLNRTFIVEEPELNLYPTTQKHLIHYLADRCTKGENELIITTHSPYVLSSFSNLLFAYQVAQKHPDKIEEIKQIIPQESWLNPAEFNAYYVGEGTVRSIFNEKTGVIGENELDDVSEDLGGEFDALMEIYKSPVNEGIH